MAVGVKSRRGWWSAVGLCLLLLAEIGGMAYFVGRPKRTAPLPPARGAAAFHLDVLLRASRPLDAAWWLTGRLGEQPGVSVQRLRGGVCEIHDASHALRVRLVEHAVDAPLLAAVLAGARRLTPQERQALAAHRAYWQVESSGGSGDPFAEATYAVKVLTVLLQEPDALGLLNVDARGYVPRSVFARSLIGVGQLFPVTVFRMFVRIERGDDGAACWMRTRGMAQFAQPDLQVRFSRTARPGDYYTLLSRCALQHLTTHQRIAAGAIAAVPGLGPYVVSAPARPGAAGENALYTLQPAP